MYNSIHLLFYCQRGKVEVQIGVCYHKINHSTVKERSIKSGTNWRGYGYRANGQEASGPINYLNLTNLTF